MYSFVPYWMSMMITVAAELSMWRLRGLAAGCASWREESFSPRPVRWPRAGQLLDWLTNQSMCRRHTVTAPSRRPTSKESLCENPIMYLLDFQHIKRQAVKNKQRPSIPPQDMCNYGLLSSPGVREIIMMTTVVLTCCLLDKTGHWQGTRKAGWNVLEGGLMAACWLLCKWTGGFREGNRIIQIREQEDTEKGTGEET